MLMKKTFLLFATAIMIFSSCSKDEDINITNLIGTWDECYDNPHFIMDGTIEYTFYVFRNPKQPKLFRNNQT